MLHRGSRSAVRSIVREDGEIRVRVELHETAGRDEETSETTEADGGRGQRDRRKQRAGKSKTERKQVSEKRKERVVNSHCLVLLTSVQNQMLPYSDL